MIPLEVAYNPVPGPIRLAHPIQIVLHQDVPGREVESLLQGEEDLGYSPGGIWHKAGLSGVIAQLKRWRERELANKTGSLL